MGSIIASFYLVLGQGDEKPIYFIDDQMELIIDVLIILLDVRLYPYVTYVKASASSTKVKFNTNEEEDE